MAVVIIPAYKPDRTLETIVEQIWQYGYQIIVVDDGSGAEYQNVFDKVKNIAVVLRHPINHGKGAALKTALYYIKEKIQDPKVIVTMDADGQHLIQDLVKLTEFSKLHKNELILGVRDVGREMPLRSRIGNQITRAVFRFISGVKVSDTQTGLRAFGAELVPELLKVEGDRYEYEMNVLMAFAQKGIPIAEIPIHTVYRDKKNTGSHFRAVRDSVRIYKDILKFTLSSLSSFILDYLLFSLFVLFLPQTAGCILLANIAARILSAFYNYGVNCRFVFHTKQRIRTAFGYFTLAGFILVMNSFVLGLFVHILRLSVYPAKFLTECLLFLISWLIQNCLIFRQEGGIRFLGRKAGL